MRPVLHDWALVPSSATPYSDPEARGACLFGTVQGHDRFEDGLVVATSRVVGKRGEFVVVRSGTLYSLAAPAENYERDFPNAKERLFAALPEIN